jgi:hypothetical protein
MPTYETILTCHCEFFVTLEAPQEVQTRVEKSFYLTTVSQTVELWNVFLYIFRLVLFACYML